MKYGIYAVYDSKTKGYMTPFFVRTDDEARRAFANEVNYGHGMLHTNPEDFDLYRVGTFDADNGNIFGGLHDSLANGVSVRVLNTVIPEDKEA